LILLIIFCDGKAITRAATQKTTETKLQSPLYEATADYFLAAFFLAAFFFAAFFFAAM